MLDILATRRSMPPHQLVAPGPDADQLRALLTLAARVPDHGKLMPWRFIVIEGAARQRLGEEIARIARSDDPALDAKRVEIERNRLARAPMVIAVVSRAQPHPKIPEWEQVLSAGAVCMNLTVAAVAMGFGTTWVTEWIGYDRRFLDLLGLEPHEKIAGYIHVGTKAETPTDRPRPNLADIVTHLTA
jgi:nitroreductase